MNTGILPYHWPINGACAVSAAVTAGELFSAALDIMQPLMAHNQLLQVNYLDYVLLLEC